MSKTQEIVDLYSEIASKLPTGFNFAATSGQSCCALHKPTKIVDGDDGCDSWSVGTHRSVQAVNFAGLKFCHAEDGQCVLDQRLYSIVSDDFQLLSLAFKASKRFKKKFTSGFPVTLRVYGSGYCYLSCFPTTARSRVARCLGPLPYVADLVRFAMVVGDYGNNKYIVHCQKSGALHVEIAKVGGLSFLELINHFLVVLKEDPFVRVGIDDSTMGLLRKTCRDLLYVDSGNGFTDVEVTLDRSGGGLSGVYGRLKFEGLVFEDNRRDSLKEWMLSRGVVVDGSALEELCLVTTATALYPVNARFLKDHVKMLGILGDSIIKVLTSLMCCVEGRGGAYYSAISGRASNVMLVSMVEQTGLRDVCSVGPLSEDSRQHADMFEAMVGVLSLHYDMDVVRMFLEEVEILPLHDGVESIMLHMGASLDVGLTSIQTQKAVALARMGII